MATEVDASSPASGTAAVFTLLTRLCAAGWIVKRWSDATTLSSDNVNLTANPYGSASSGAGNLGNTSAWFRVAAPDASREWLFQRGSADQTWTISRSKAGFTGGSPDATTLPTATDTATLFSATQAFPTTTWRMFVSCDDAASYGWRCFGVPSGGGNVLHFLIDEPLQNGSIDTSDTDPYLSWRYYNGTGLAASTGAIRNVMAANIYKRFTGAGSNQTPTLLIYTNQANSFGTADQVAPPGSTAGQVGLTPNTLSEVPLPIPVCRPGTSSSTTGWIGFCGTLRWGSVGGRDNGLTLSVGGSVYYIYCAGMWVPWDSSEPALS